MQKTRPANVEALRFPSLDDIKASLGGKVTRCGNRVLWSPNDTRSAFRILEGVGGRLRLRPWFQDYRVESPYHAPKVPEWTSKANWLYRDSVIASEVCIPISTVAYWRKKLGKS